MYNVSSVVDGDCVDDVIAGVGVVVVTGVDVEYIVVVGGGGVTSGAIDGVGIVIGGIICGIDVGDVGVVGGMVADDYFGVVVNELGARWVRVVGIHVCIDVVT